MKQSKNIERILTGNLWKGILLISLPLMLNNLIQQLYNLSDALWVGRLGSVPFAATSFVWPVLFLFVSMGMGITMAGTSILAQFVGAQDTERSEQYATLILWIAGIFAVTISLIAYLITPFAIRWMGATGEFATLSIVYLRILFIGMPLQFMYFAINGIFQAQGVTVIGMLLSALSTGLNMILNPFFIFSTIPGTSIGGLGLGIAGAAWATVASQGILLLVIATLIRKRSPAIQVRWLPVRWDAAKVRKIFQLGIPSIIGQSGAAFGFVVLNGMIAAFGTDTIAAYGLVNRVSGLAMLPAMGIGSAMNAIVGQNIGNGRLDRAKQSLRIGFVLATTITIAGSLPILLGDRALMTFFLPLEEGSTVLSLALHFLRYALVINPFMGYFSVLQGFFQGTGHTRYSMMMEVARLWVIRIPFILLLQYAGVWQPDGIWWAMLVSNVLVIFIGLAFYKKGRWKESILELGGAQS